MNPKRPILRYHGGKWMLSKWIISHFKEHRIYTEAYGGGASVLLNKRRSYAEVYNDQWDLVVNVFLVLRDPTMAARLFELISLTPYSRTEFETSPAKIAECLDPVEKARLTILRSFMGFGSGSTNPNSNTGFRADSSRNGTTAMIDWKNYPKHIESFTNRLKGVTIENRHAFDILKKHDTRKTLHYVDPPYVHSTRNSSQKAYAYEMSDQEHEDLSELLHDLKGMVIISGYESDLYSELYKDWKCIARMATTTNSHNKKKEVIWLNPSAAEGGQKSMFE